MWTIGLGILTAGIAAMWAVTEAHGLFRRLVPHTSPVTPQATTNAPLLFGPLDGSALETLMQGGDPSLLVEQKDDEGTLTLTVKRKRVAKP